MLAMLLLKIQRHQNHYAMVKNREILLNINEDVLAKAGISRALVLQGVEHWPWRGEDQSDSAPVSDSLKSSDTEGCLPDPPLLHWAQPEVNTVNTDTRKNSNDLVEKDPGSAIENSLADYIQGQSTDRAA